jgi:hypothetical protein
VRDVHGLWHIDLNLKLKEFGMYITGGIDGKSRLIVFMDVSDNNRQENVLRGFHRACCEYGAQKRVRTDKGGENRAMLRRQLMIRRTADCVFTGRSDRPKNSHSGS